MPVDVEVVAVTVLSLIESLRPTVVAVQASRLVAAVAVGTGIICRNRRGKEVILETAIDVAVGPAFNLSLDYPLSSILSPLSYL